MPVNKSKNQELKTKDCLGLALDLGTTVIKGCVVDIRTGKIIRQAKTYNAQNQLGANVISRISKSLQGRTKLLRQLLFSTITGIQKELDITRPSFTTVVGNTAMLSFYLNRPVDGLAKFPFQSKLSKGIYTTKPARYIFPVIGGFVGGDTIAGIIAAGLWQAKKNVLYVDLGTNGEVVLIKGKKIYATSTAAGPAFEGVGISLGSLAIPGAINKVWFRDRKLLFRTINNQKPVGVCASGLIDLLALMLKQKWLQDNGRLDSPVILSRFRITQLDIRKIQLAIAAIHAGIETLLNLAKVSPRELNAAVITGEFGDKLDKSNLMRLGVVPRGIKKISFEHDLPLKGAVAALLDRNKTREAEAIRKSSAHIELARQKDFQKIFVQAMRFKPWH